MSVNVIGYYIDRDVEKEKAGAADVFLVYENENNRGTFLEGYAPIGQHINISDVSYLDECTKISKEVYKKISGNYYTPKEYL